MIETSCEPIHFSCEYIQFRTIHTVKKNPLNNPMKLAVSLYSLKQSIEGLLKKGLSSIFGNLLAIFQS